MTAIAPLEYLFGLERYGIKLGLSNIAELCRALDHPERLFPSVIVAGTNGKGSVAAMVEKALRTAGLKTGCFTSPHLVALEERFAIGGQAISSDDLAREAATLQATVLDLQAARRLEAPPTFFEATTAIAFSLFRRSSVQVAILEVGMGGRFDATNIVTPSVAVVTNIDFDHQQHLGRTLSEIAFEKAGVIKPDGLVVTGETKPEPLGVLRETCAERRCRLLEAPADVHADVTMSNGLTHMTLTTPVGKYGPLVLALRGRHQVENAAVAVRVLETLGETGLGSIDAAAIRAGLTDTRWPGRLELVHVPGRGALLLDAAHNGASAAALQRYLGECYPSGVPMVLAAMRDKDVPEMLRALRPSATRAICTSVSTPRAMSATDLDALVASCCPDLARAVADTPRAAVDLGWQASDVVCAAGSVYLVGALVSDMPMGPGGAKWPG